jgi:hypothetical protein
MSRIALVPELTVSLDVEVEDHTWVPVAESILNGFAANHAEATELHSLRAKIACIMALLWHIADVAQCERVK